MPSRSFKDREVYVSASATLCLPLVQVSARGVLFLRHDSPFVFSLRIFRYGSLIGSRTSTEFQSIFDISQLIFPEKPQHLTFDVVVAGYFSPVVHFLVFPLYLNISYVRDGSLYRLLFPGDKKDKWKANLAAVITQVILRERHLYRRKTIWVSQTSRNFSGGVYVAGS